MENILKVKNMNISIQSKKSKKIIVENGEFEVNRGEFVLILGENGAGKSSIFRSLLREGLKGIKDERELFFKGEPIDTQKKLDNFRRSIGYARQEDDSDKFFVRNFWQYVKYYAGMSSYFSSAEEVEKEAMKVYEDLDCEKYADGELKERKLKKCSGGEKRMATLLSALSRSKSDLFILDEPINNLDAYHARLLNNYLIKLKKSATAPGILLITHCHMFQKLDRVYKLSKGKITEVNDYSPKTCYGNCNSDGFYLEE